MLTIAHRIVYHNLPLAKKSLVVPEFVRIRLKFMCACSRAAPFRASSFDAPHCLFQKAQQQRSNTLMRPCRSCLVFFLSYLVYSYSHHHHHEQLEERV